MSHTTPLQSRHVLRRCCCARARQAAAAVERHARAPHSWASRPAIASRPRARSRRASPLNRRRWCSGASAMDRFEEEPPTVLAELHRARAGGRRGSSVRARRAVLSARERSGDRGNFWLRPSMGARCSSRAAAAAQLHQSDPRLRLAYDFYNQGVAQGLTDPERTRPAHN